MRHDFRLGLLAHRGAARGLARQISTPRRCWSLLRPESDTMAETAAGLGTELFSSFTIVQRNARISSWAEIGAHSGYDTGRGVMVCSVLLWVCPVQAPKFTEPSGAHGDLGFSRRIAFYGDSAPDLESALRKVLDSTAGVFRAFARNCLPPFFGNVRPSPGCGARRRIPFSCWRSLQSAGRSSPAFPSKL